MPSPWHNQIYHLIICIQSTDIFLEDLPVQFEPPLTDISVGYQGGRHLHRCVVELCEDYFIFASGILRDVLGLGHCVDGAVKPPNILAYKVLDE